MRRASCLAVAAVAVLVTACSSGSPDTDFAPSPGGTAVEGGGVHIDPIIPTPSLRGGPTGGGEGTSPNPSASAPAQDPLVVATKLTTPTGIALLPDGTALVGERTTGRIVRVQPTAGKPVPTVRTLTGLVTTGDGGLLDLAVSPDYAEDDLVYAYVTTRTDNRVVDFTLGGPVTPVLTGIPRGTSDNAGRIAFGADGDLYVATGDAGRPALAARASSLAGKVLRVTDIGGPARGNPSARSPVLATGFRSTAGLCASPGGNVYQVEQRGDAAAVVNVVTAGGYYGWPSATAATKKPVSTLPATYRGPGGCAVQSGRVWVTSLDGRSLVSGGLVDAVSPRVGAYAAVLTNTYGRLLTVFPAPDGALWITTSNRDGRGTPVAADERVIRYPPQSVGGTGGRTT